MVLVNGAAGAVGSIVGQLAKIEVGKDFLNFKISFASSNYISRVSQKFIVFLY